MALTFDKRLLPVKLSLPMVVEPIPWKLVDGVSEDNINRLDQQPFNSIIRGGYLRATSRDIMDGTKLLSIKHSNNYDIRFNNLEQAKKQCAVINKLQAKRFKINKPWLDTLEKDSNLLVEQGLLIDKKLQYLSYNEASEILRVCYMENKTIQKSFSYSDLLKRVICNIHKCKYDTFIIDLARALSGLSLYFPVYLDFRGRNYRAGLGNFHDRDLSRSLLHFDGYSGNMDDVTDIICNATLFHRKKYTSYNAKDLVKDQMSFCDKEKWSNFHNNPEDIYKDARYAKNPFQYLANMTILYNG